MRSWLAIAIGVALAAGAVWAVAVWAAAVPNAAAPIAAVPVAALPVAAAPVAAVPAATVAATVAAAAIGIGNDPRRVPRLVFVSRPQLEASRAPGIGPAGREPTPGGQLLVRERSGRIRPLLSAAPFTDVGDPAVSWDARRILFAGVRAPGTRWRIWVVDADGNGLRCLTCDSDPPEITDHDDFDPCWLPDDRIVFASTRWPLRAQDGDYPVSNLFVVELDATPPLRITSERNGAEEPSIDPHTGRVVYARWWLNRYLPSDHEPFGITLDPSRAVPQDTINLWTSGSVAPDGEGLRLAGGDARSHTTLMSHQPIVLRDGTLVGVWAETPSLVPTAGRAGVRAFGARQALAGRDAGALGGAPGTGRKAGRLAEDHPGIGPALALVGLGSPLGGTACSPAEAPDGRLLFSWAPDPILAVEAPAREAGRVGTGFGICISKRDGTGVARVVDLRGTDELDVAVFERRDRPPILALEFPLPPLTASPVTRPEAALEPGPNTFRFDCLNVFAQAAVDAAIPDAPSAQQDLRIRFYSVVARPGSAGGDSVVFLREAPVDPSGAVHVDDILADAPTFEQLVDGDGRVLRSARGPTHVPGFNFARAGGGTKCVGCHTGHSAIPVPVNNFQAKWFNAGPSAQVEATSSLRGPARRAVDRRTLGPPAEVAWVAESPGPESIRLSWNQRTLEVRCVVLYGLDSAPRAGTTLRVRETEISLLRDGRRVRHLVIRRTLEPQGTRIDIDPVVADAVEITPTRLSGLVDGRRAAALAEIEVIARLLED